MSELTDRSIIALRTIHDGLAERVAGFSDTDLARPSGATEWDVAQVLSHLGSGAEIALAVLTAGLAGEPTPDQEFNQGVWARWNALDRRGQADGFRTAHDRLVGALEALPAEVRESASFPWFLPFPVGVELFTGLRLSETAQHTWDVLVAADPTAPLPAAATGPLLDLLTGPATFLIGILGKPDALAGRTAKLAVVTADPAHRFGLSLDQQIGVGPVPEAPDGVLEAPAEAVTRLIAGRLRPEHTPKDIALSGPITLDDLRATFPGY